MGRKLGGLGAGLRVGKRPAWLPTPTATQPAQPGGSEPHRCHLALEPGACRWSLLQPAATVHHVERGNPQPEYTCPCPQARSPALPASRADGALQGWQESQLPVATPFPTPVSIPCMEGSPRPIVGWCFPGGRGREQPATSCPTPSCASSAAPPPGTSHGHQAVPDTTLRPLGWGWMETGRLLSGQSYSGPRGVEG